MSKRLIRPEYLELSLKKNKGLREVLLFIGVSLFYKISRFIAIGDERTAFANAYKVVNFEKAYGLFIEIPIQHFFLKMTMLIRFLNRFYILVHVPSIILFFLYLYHKQRRYYYFIRNSFLLANFITLFIFMWFPCAPPRMLGSLGFTDTLLQVSHMNLYKSSLTHFFNQYAAMPSMHFGTSLIIGICMCIFTRSTWLRILFLLYPLFVLFVIIVTGNHFVSDALVGAAVSALGFTVIYIYINWFMP